jgi:hypothetical protein
MVPVAFVGPITVGVETISTLDTRFPLYVEVVPLQGSEWFPPVCENLPGNVVLIVYGHFDEPCGAWDEAGPIDITNVVPLGSLYALRLYFFDRGVSGGGTSPALGCLRVTAHPVETRAVAPATWGRVKALFR